MSITFLHPWFLSLLLLLPLVAWYRFRQKEYQVSLKLPATDSIRHLTWKSRLHGVLPWLQWLAMAALIIALARPQRLLKEEKIEAEGIDIFLVMDLSSSMLAQDFKPDRLEASKRVAIEFVDKRPFDRLGLVVFAGEAFTNCPLTTDHQVLKEFIENLQCGALEDGTAIGMGLATAVNRIKDSPSKSKVIILMTDGVNNAGYIKPLTAAAIAKEFGVRVYTIGVGQEGEALSPISRRSDGRYVFGFTRVEIDEELLQQIAEMTGARYFRATNVAALEAIYQEIDKLEKTKIQTTVLKRHTEEFHHFAAFALMILLLELMLRYGLLRRIP